jgi:DNA-binding transcriptional LysR family regulator
MADAFDGISMFIAVAEENGFRSAGRRLAVSGSAVSQAISQLEERLGVALFYRTTRNVRLTEAGERLYRAVRPALDEVRSALEGVRELGEEPSGTLRLNVSTAAESILRGPMLSGFLRAYPRVQLDLIVSQHPGEIVSAGFDAGVALGEVIEQDMIAVPVSGDLRLVVVGAPSYFAMCAVPEHPRDLVHHTCINWRPGPDDPPYRWEFAEGGRDFSVAVEARVLTNDPELNLRLSLQGVGLTMVFESWLRDHVEKGELVTVLEEYCPPFPGLFLYYPQRRQASPALRALIDHLRQAKRR